MSQLVDSSLASQFEKLPPHSRDAEMCLLASMMLDKEIIGQAVQMVDREAFFQADHQVIFDVLLKLYEQNRPIDAVIVREELSKRQLLEEVGGSAYLASLLGMVPSAAHGGHYASIVREKAMLRQLIGASNEILRDAYAPTSRRTSFWTGPRSEFLKSRRKRFPDRSPGSAKSPWKSTRCSRTRDAAGSKAASAKSTKC